MTAVGNLLERMRTNPRDWAIDDLKTLAKWHGVDWRQPGTSHVTFSHPGRAPLTVPAHRPAKSFYVIRFLALVDGLKGEIDE